MQPLTGRELEQILLKNGFILSRQHGSHRIYKNTETGATVPLAFHAGNAPVPIGTFLAIVRQSKLPKHVFTK